MLFFIRKMQDDLSEIIIIIIVIIIIIHGNIIFSVYLVKMVFIFPANMIIHFCQKSKDCSLTENALNITFPVLFKKMIFNFL